MRLHPDGVNDRVGARRRSGRAPRGEVADRARGRVVVTPRPPPSRRSATRSTPMISRFRDSWATRVAMSPIGPRPSTRRDAAGGHARVLDRLPCRRKNVGEVDETVVGRSLGHLDRTVVGLGHPEVFCLAAGHLAVELGVAEQAGPDCRTRGPGSSHTGTGGPERT